MSSYILQRLFATMAAPKYHSKPFNFPLSTKHPAFPPDVFIFPKIAIPQ